MITNLVILSTVLLTNSQQAIIGESNGKALVASQETVTQQTDLGYIKKRKPVKMFQINNVISSRLTTNTVPIVFKPAILTNVPSVQSGAAITDTNSPAFKRRLEREQRMRPSTNAPPTQDDPRK